VKNLRDALKVSDPVAREPGLSDDERRALRRTAVAAADRARERAPWWRPTVMAATIAVVIAAGIAGRNYLPLRVREHATPRIGRPPQPVQTTSADDARRQIQFATPGGTRIIWIFDPEFHP
jgi:hypothetical protein